MPKGGQHDAGESGVVSQSDSSNDGFVESLRTSVVIKLKNLNGYCSYISRRCSRRLVFDYPISQRSESCVQNRGEW